MLACIKQHLRNIWSSIHEKVKQDWDGVENKALLIRKPLFHMKTRVCIKYFVNDCSFEALPQKYSF